MKENPFLDGDERVCEEEGPLCVGLTLGEATSSLGGREDLSSFLSAQFTCMCTRSKGPGGGSECKIKKLESKGSRANLSNGG